MATLSRRQLGRLTSFDPTTLSASIERHEVLRTHVMRTTIHLVTAADALAFRGACRARHESDLRSGSFAKGLAGLDLDEVTSNRPGPVGGSRAVPQPALCCPG